MRVNTKSTCFNVHIYHAFFGITHTNSHPNSSKRQNNIGLLSFGYVFVVTGKLFLRLPVLTRPRACCRIRIIKISFQYVVWVRKISLITCKDIYWPVITIQTSLMTKD